jgi:hypothetical protein
LCFVVPDVGGQIVPLCCVGVGLHLFLILADSPLTVIEEDKGMYERLFDDGPAVLILRLFLYEAFYVPKFGNQAQISQWANSVLQLS